MVEETEEHPVYDEEEVDYWNGEEFVNFTYLP